MDRHVSVLADTYGIAAAPITPQLFAGAGKEHMEKYGKTCIVPRPLRGAVPLPCGAVLVQSHSYKVQSHSHVVSHEIQSHSPILRLAPLLLCEFYALQFLCVMTCIPPFSVLF